MLDENEFKPFTLNDFSAADAASENTEGIPAPADNLAISDQIESFKPLTFEAVSYTHLTLPTNREV